MIFVAILQLGRLTVFGEVAFIPKAEVTLEISGLKIKTIGVVLTGTATFTVDTSYDFIAK